MSLQWTSLSSHFQLSLKVPLVQEEVQEVVRQGKAGEGRARGKDGICRHPRVQLVTSCVCAGDGGCVRLFTLGQRPYLHFSYP